MFVHFHEEESIQHFNTLRMEDVISFRYKTLFVLRQGDSSSLPWKQTLSSHHQGGSIPQDQLPGLPELGSEVPAPQPSVPRDRLHLHQGGAEAPGHQGPAGGETMSRCQLNSRREEEEASAVCWQSEGDTSHSHLLSQLADGGRMWSRGFCWV